MKSYILLLFYIPILLFVFCSFNNNMAVDNIIINFDRLFPEKSLQIIFENCSKIQYELDLFFIQDDIGSEDLLLFIDVLVGKLFYLSCSVKTILDKDIPVLEVDVTYLITFIEKILVKYEKCYFDRNYKNSKNVIKLINSIMNDLNKILKNAYSLDLTKLFFPNNVFVNPVFLTESNVDVFLIHTI